MTTANKFPQFKQFALVGDTIQWEKEGFTFTATLHADSDTSVREYDCYSPDEIKAWENDGWFYVGIIISVKKNGVLITDNAASIWGVECNFLGNDNSYLVEVCRDMEDEALDTALIQRDIMLKALQD